MAGFFGLFGSKTKYVDEEGVDDNSQNSSESFFLSPDDAKTFGNIDYMRTAKKIRRTFPKTRSNQNTEFIQDVASIENADTSTQQAPAKPVAAAPTVQAPSQPVATVKPTVEETKNKSNTQERRRPDSSMDMFRNMAREIGK